MMIQEKKKRRAQRLASIQFAALQHTLLPPPQQDPQLSQQPHVQRELQ